MFLLRVRCFLQVQIGVRGAGNGAFGVLEVLGRLVHGLGCEGSAFLVQGLGLRV